MNARRWLALGLLAAGLAGCAGPADPGAQRPASATAARTSTSGASAAVGEPSNAPSTTGPRARDAALLAAARTQIPAVIDTLRELVEIDSASGHAPGLAKMAEHLEGRLRQLGLSTERSSAAPAVGQNLVGRLRGTGRGRVLLMAHMDTVFPPGVAPTKPFRVDGSRAYGPGIADDKGGVAVILHTLALLRARGFADFAEIVVLFNPDEERGSLGSRELIERLSREVDHVLSFEPTSAAREGLLLATSGTAAINVTVKGKAAHAGAAPELGVNALTELADLMLRTLDLDDKARGVRFNWTTARGGETRNIIPDQATMGADMRFLRNEDAEATLAELRRRIEKKRLPDAQIVLNVVMGRPAFQAGPGGRVLIDNARAIYRELGLELTVSPLSGGGTDAGYAARSGKPVIEALGLPGYGFHSTEEEYVRIDRIAERLYLAARMIMDLTTGR